MGRGERVARVYVAMVLVGQALLSAACAVSPAALAAQVAAAGVLLLVYVTERPSPLLRALTVLPAFAASVYWAALASPFGTVGWIGWGVATLWLCLPAGWDADATLAETFHGRRDRSTQSGE